MSIISTSRGTETGGLADHEGGSARRTRTFDCIFARLDALHETLLAMNVPAGDGDGAFGVLETYGASGSGHGWKTESLEKEVSVG